MIFNIPQYFECALQDRLHAERVRLDYLPNGNVQATAFYREGITTEATMSDWEIGRDPEWAFKHLIAKLTLVVTQEEIDAERERLCY